MTTKTKVANYSPELTEKIKVGYLAGETIETLAEMAGKTVRSVRAKLSKEGVYKAKEYTTKNGEKPVKKDETANSIGKILGLSDGESDSLAKANKTALQKILDALTAE